MKNKLIVFCFFILWVTLVPAQENGEKKHCTLSGFFYPEYTFRFLVFDKVCPKNTRDMIRKDELSKYGYSFGILAGFKINKWLSVKTGLNYFSMGYASRPIISGSTKEYTNYKLGTINFPLKASLTLFSYRSFSLVFDLGIHPGLGIDREITYHFQGFDQVHYTEMSRKYSPYDNPLRILTTAEINLEYEIKRWVLGLSGGFKLNLIPINEELHTTTHDYLNTNYVFSAGGGINIGFIL
jgi:hypothetical protein